MLNAISSLGGRTVLGILVGLVLLWILIIFGSMMLASRRNRKAYKQYLHERQEAELFLEELKQLFAIHIVTDPQWFHVRGVYRFYYELCALPSTDSQLLYDAERYQQAITTLEEIHSRAVAWKQDYLDVVAAHAATESAQLLAEVMQYSGDVQVGRDSTTEEYFLGLLKYMEGRNAHLASACDVYRRLDGLRTPRIEAAERNVAALTVLTSWNNRWWLMSTQTSEPN